MIAKLREAISSALPRTPYLRAPAAKSKGYGDIARDMIGDCGIGKITSPVHIWGPV